MLARSIRCDIARTGLSDHIETCVTRRPSTLDMVVAQGVRHLVPAPALASLVIFLNASQPLAPSRRARRCRTAPAYTASDAAKPWFPAQGYYPKSNLKRWLGSGRWRYRLISKLHCDQWFGARRRIAFAVHQSHRRRVRHHMDRMTMLSVSPQ